MRELDAIDRKLLEQLQIDTRMPMETMADRVGLSGPACYRRVRRLRESGVIDREVAIVKPRLMGWPLSMIVLVTLERERAQTVDVLIRQFAAVPEIIDSWLVTGDHDFALRMVARDMESFDDLTRRIFVADDNIRSFKTLVVLRHTKAMSPIVAADVG